MEAKTELKAGVDLLDTLLIPAGFKFELEREGDSSGGQFCCGAYIRGNRRLELHFRYSLGRVNYTISDQTLSHENYLRAQDAKGEYPGFSDKPITEFKHLYNDLENFGAIFLTGQAEKFIELVKWVEKNPKKTGIKSL